MWLFQWPSSAVFLALDGRFTGKTINDLPRPIGIAKGPDGCILVICGPAEKVYILKKMIYLTSWVVSMPILHIERNGFCIIYKEQNNGWCISLYFHLGYWYFNFLSYYIICQFFFSPAPAFHSCSLNCLCGNFFTPDLISRLKTSIKKKGIQIGFSLAFMHFHKILILLLQWNQTNKALYDERCIDSNAFSKQEEM